MPAGSERKRKWWASKSRLEKIFMGVIVVAIIVVIILLVLVLKKSESKCILSETCDSADCLTAATKILQYVDPEENPCEDFYQFACGNFLKSAHGDERLDLLHTLKDQSKRELLEAYLDPIRSADHKMVKAVKKLFRACMNKEAIETEKFAIIKRALTEVGGWPVVDVRSWNATNFDWLNATYKLRELGYYYTAFLELAVEHDPDNPTQFIFKVAMPFMWDYSSQNFDKVKFMTDVAIQLGAPPPDEIIVETMTSVHQFLTQLQLEAHSRYYMGTYKKFTVEQYQQMYGAIDWLQFINNIAGPTASISKADFVLFPPPETLRSWINVISRTPKRVQANYMVWKVIEQAIPFLTDGVQNLNLRNRRDETRQEFCLREIQERFIPSPADIMCDRKYLPVEKKKKIEEFVLHFKSELVTALENIEWMEKKVKQAMVDKAKAIRVLVGQPEDYFGDKILDDLDADMVDTQSNSFAELMAQAIRNRQTILYNQIKKPNNTYEKWYIKDASGLPIYDETENVLYVPTIVTDSLIYKENRPQYLNYGAMGTQLGVEFSNLLVDYLRGATTNERSNQTKQDVSNKLQCLEKEMQTYSSDLKVWQSTNLMQLDFGEELSYAAYDKWLKTHGDELKLIKTDYTPKQLFWISLGSLFCKPVNEFSISKSMHGDGEDYSTLISASVRNHHRFARDFHCPAESKMNASNKCIILSG